MTVKMFSTGNTSAVSVYDKDNHYGWLIYDNKIHKYLADSAFSSLNTENKTYGDNAVIELFNYYLSRQNN